MGEFYGMNLFLAESSATTGGLDSLLEPTGNIKVAQDKAARALGGDRSFFVTNGTSTSNRSCTRRCSRPGDIVLIDRDCHKSHHYGLVLAGAQPLTSTPSHCPSTPCTAASRLSDQEGAAAAESRGEARPGETDRPDQLHLRRARGQRQEDNAGVPRDQADICFLWDEAWFGFARFSPFLRRRTAMGAASAIREMMRDPEYRKRYEKFNRDG